MTTIKLRKWDSADHLKTHADMVAYLEACFEEAGDDPAFIVKALGVVARAQNMTELARKSGVTREGLYKAFSATGNPTFATVLKLLHALGLELHVKPAA